MKIENWKLKISTLVALLVALGTISVALAADTQLGGNLDATNYGVYNLSGLGIGTSTITSGQICFASGCQSTPYGGGTQQMNASYLTQGTFGSSVSGSNNQYLFKPTTDTTAALGVQTSGSASVFDVDTLNQRVGVKTATPTGDLSVEGSVFSRNGLTSNLVLDPQFAHYSTYWGNVAGGVQAIERLDNGQIVNGLDINTTGNVQVINNPVPVDPYKTYRFSIWIKENNTDSSLYFGMHAFNSALTQVNTYNSAGTGSINNYFWYGDLASTNVWYHKVGYLLPCNTANGWTNPPDTATNNFRMDCTTAFVKIRFLNFDAPSYGTGIGTDANFALPAIEEVQSASPTFSLNGSDYIIDPSGNVGIGTTTPAVPLSVVGAANFTGTVTAGGFSGPMSGTLSSANVSAGQFGGNTGGGDYVFPGKLYVGLYGYANQAGDLAVSRNAASSTGVVYFGNNSTHYLYYDGTNFNFSGGGLVVPTVNATGKIIYLNGTDRISDAVSTSYTRIQPQSSTLIIYNGGANNQNLLVYGASGSQGVQLAGSTSNPSLYGFGTGVSMSVYGGNVASANLTLDSTSNATKGYVILAPSGGNVGIGTTTPGYNLTVKGGTTQDFSIVDTGDVGFQMVAGGSINAFSIRTASGVAYLSTENSYGLALGVNTGTGGVVASTNGLYINASGNVGIATTTPAVPLSVVGDANFTGTVTAGGFSGPMSGTLSAGNISSGSFGASTGGGNYSFPASLNVVAGGLGVGTSTVQAAGNGYFTGALTAATLNTGQGANELYAMNQNVQTTDSPTFATGNFTGIVNVSSASTSNFGNGTTGSIKIGDGTISKTSGSSFNMNSGLVLVSSLSATTGAFSGAVTATSFGTGLVQSTASGNSYFTGGNVGIGTNGPSSPLQIGPASAAGSPTSNLFLSSSTGNAGIVFASYSARYSSPQNVGGIYALAGGGWYSAFDFKFNNAWGNPTIEGMTLASAGGGTPTLSVGSGTGKVSAGTVDPPYTIGGIKYATYNSAMTGVKEETTGVVNLKGGAATLDISSAPNGSDLWLWSQTTDLANEGLGNVVVLLTPSFDGRVWYEKQGMNIVIKSDVKSGQVSYRLTAPRFDYQGSPFLAPGTETYGNLRPASDASEGFNLDKLIK